MFRKMALVFLIAAGSLDATAARNRHPHYIFTLPNGYAGWIQIIFNDPKASPLPKKDRSYVMEVPESGIVRTSDLRVRDLARIDQFSYRSPNPDGGLRLKPVPTDIVLSGDSHGGFGVMDTGGRGLGYSWFIFIGPPELRAKDPQADWDKFAAEYRKSHGGHGGSSSQETIRRRAG